MNINKINLRKEGILLVFESKFRLIRRRKMPTIRKYIDRIKMDVKLK